jgi:hypothetical protein
MADVLVMSALQFGNPIQTFVQVKINNFPHRPDHSCLHRFHGTVQGAHPPNVS